MARGSISKNGKKWRLRYSTGRHAETGSRTYVTRTFDTKNEAERFRAELVIEDGGDQYEGRHFTLDQAIGNYFRTRKHAPTFRYDLERAEKLIPAEYLEIAVGRLRSADLVRLYDELAIAGVPTSRVYRVHELIRGALTVAVRYEWIDRNVAKTTAPPKHKRKTPTPPTPQLLEKLLDAVDGDTRLWLRIASTTGARRGEVAGLMWSDIDLDADVVRIRRAVSYAPGTGLVVGPTKTGEERRLAIGPKLSVELGEALTAQQARSELAGDTWETDRYVIGADPFGIEPWRPDRVTHQITRLKKERPDLAGVTIKELRHYVATQALAGGADVRTVAGRLGHAQTSTTVDIYAAFVPESDRGIANALD